MRPGTVTVLGCETAVVCQPGRVWSVFTWEKVVLGPGCLPGVCAWGDCCHFLGIVCVCWGVGGAGVISSVLHVVEHHSLERFSETV